MTYHKRTARDSPDTSAAARVRAPGYQWDNDFDWMILRRQQSAEGGERTSLPRTKGAPGPSVPPPEDNAAAQAPEEETSADSGCAQGAGVGGITRPD